jgi:hypothetical protein
MTDGKWWVALVAFERRNEEQAILPNWAYGAVGWMVANAPDQDAARNLLVREMGNCGLTVVEINDEREVFRYEEIEEIDPGLATNFREMKLGERTAWGTLYCYIGEGEA